MRIADIDSIELRFPIGTRVECNCGVWKAGTIVAHFYYQSSFGDDKCVPYQVKLDEGGKLIFAPSDEDTVVRRLVEETGGRRKKGKKDKKAPVLATAGVMWLCPKRRCGAPTCYSRYGSFCDCQRRRASRAPTSVAVGA